MTRDLVTNRPSSSTRILARILESPDLASAVQSLPAPALVKLIDAVGLEDAGEIVAFATPAQLAEVFDEDLWRSDQPGSDERFDGDRFLVWLEVMMEAGDAFVSSLLADLPEDLVALALRAHVLVLDMDALLAEMREADEDEGKAVEKALSNCLSEEIEQYQLVSRRHDGWDTVLGAVLALDRDHHDTLMRILDRLCALTSDYVDREGGLHSALTSEEMLEADVAGDREDRRAEAGFVAPADARAFLKLARQPLRELPRDHDPVTRGYFSRLRGLASKNTAPATPPPSNLSRVLLEAGVTLSPGATPLLVAGAGAQGPRESILVRAMRALAESDAGAFAARSEEIAYLANVLVAGGSEGGRRYRPVEAVQKAIAVCSRGLELAATEGDPVAILRAHPAEGLFRRGWSEGG